MSKVTISFEVIGDDEDHNTGMSERMYEDVMDAIMGVGGFNVDIISEPE